MSNVTVGSVRYETDYMTFEITDGASTVKVVYNGFIILDSSTGYAEVVVKGIYDPGEGVRDLRQLSVEGASPSSGVSGVPRN